MKPTLKAPEAKRLKLRYYELLSKLASNFDLRRYIEAELINIALERLRRNRVVGRCRLTLSNPR